MKRVTFSLLLSAVLLPGVFAADEKTVVIGGGSGWDAVETRSAVTEISLARPHPVLALSSALTSRPAAAAGLVPAETPSADLHLSFDRELPGFFAGGAESPGRWQVSVSGGVSRTEQARAGSGAARFTGIQGNGETLVLEPGPAALFAPKSRAGDFTVEFWMFPLSLENGEELFRWTSVIEGYTVQQVQCAVSKNRLRWTFDRFFADPSGTGHVDLAFSGSPVLPGTWSHHLIRYNAGIGIVEYLVDGRLEAVEYATSTGAEGGEVYTPLTGENGRLVLGGYYSGLMDEFSLYGYWLAAPVLAKYGTAGRAETRTIDLGKASSRVLRIEASGGQTAARGGVTRNTFAGSNRLVFADYSEVRLFIRAADNPYGWNAIPWIPVQPGEELEGLTGRFVQAAADFYPSGDGESSPYLDELRIIYHSADPPPPPSLVSAVAGDGMVELSWRPGSGREADGYLVYFGTSGGEYFGEGDILDGKTAQSPVDAGNRTGVRIGGLKNGTLYYFAVAAYSGQWNGDRRETGEFSREIAARPLKESYGGTR
jgi:hypothetical protein